MKLQWIVAVAGVVVATVGAGGAPVSGFRVVAEYPHDRGAFTQGLVIAGGVLYEGTGLEGESSLRKVDLKTGRVQAQQNLDRQYFGEGIAILDGQIFQLTWRNKFAVVYDLETLNYLKTLRYSGEGWGLTSDGKHLIMSDGSSTLRILNPKTFEVVRRLEVRSGRKAVDKLNELEFVNGEIWANIWHSDRIARISPQTGEVLGWIDLTALYPLAQRANRECVLNGIAYDAEKKRIFVTGKNWPKLYEIELTTPKGK
ncbi:MAG: glutaminyl-peptide cyclotransferase [Planctomycetaceae bacterium]